MIVAVLVVGPRQLPAMMRSAGQWIARIRRMVFDMRTQSGIDDILRNEGLDQDIRQFRSLVRGNVLDAIAVDVEAEIEKSGRPTSTRDASLSPARAPGTISSTDDVLLKDSQEYPIAGCDAYGAVPEDVEMYRPEPHAVPAEPSNA